MIYLSEGMENCKMSGKNQGILRWMISGNPVLCLGDLDPIIRIRSQLTNVKFSLKMRFFNQ